jgi:two-component system copper resistance phosphate regulon response regulator CusR
VTDSIVFCEIDSGIIKEEKMESSTKVLVVEDEPLMAGFIARGLRENGYEVDIAPDGGQAVSRAGANDYHLVILDLRLPVKDGFTVCRELREQSFLSPILMLTALDDDESHVNGLNSGADDYLPKPFDFDLLLARIRALLRRSRQFRGNLIQVADLSLNTLDHTVMRAGRSIRLTAKEYALLELLMLHEGQILGRAQIAEHVWDEDFDPLSNIIDVYVKRLRKKIDCGSDPPLIHTRRSEGYMLSADAQDISYV